MWPFDTRRLQAELAAVKADRERIRGERNQFKDDRDSFKYAAESASEKYTDTCIVNECLTEDLAKAKEQLAAYTGSRTVAEVLEEHEAHRQAIADAIGYQDPHLTWDRLTAVVAHIAKVAAEWQADYKVQKDRADLFEAQLANAARETDRLNAELAEAREQAVNQSAAHWSAQARREKKRADRLQKQYDDAVGLSGARPQDSRRWQPGYKEDAS